MREAGDDRGARERMARAGARDHRAERPGGGAGGGDSAPGWAIPSASSLTPSATRCRTSGWRPRLTSCATGCGRSRRYEPESGASIFAAALAHRAADAFAGRSASEPASAARGRARGNRRRFVRHSAALGYAVEPLVTEAGQVSRRGGIIDVFPPARGAARCASS